MLKSQLELEVIELDGTVVVGAPLTASCYRSRCFASHRNSFKVLTSSGYKGPYFCGPLRSTEAS